VIGLVVGLVIGGMAVEVSGPVGVGDTTVDVRVEVLGVTVRQGVGPEPMERVVWTWGIGWVAMFGLAGLAVAIAGRMGAEKLLRALAGKNTRV
jgi:hypothetical protein